jgi:CheY-like chemotaxis protein
MVAMGLLSRLGFAVEVVSDGRQAVEAVEATDYAAVLMDCNMPVMDGYAATAAIRHQEGATGGRVPIVAMTASALVGDRERCLAAGMDDYLSKPVTLAQLDLVLSRWCRVTGGPAGPDAVDAGQLESLRGLDGGDGQFLANVVDSFLSSSQVFLARMAAAIEENDGAELAREAHRFKGEASTLGAAALADLCAQLQAAASPLDLSAAGELLARAERELQRVWARLRAEVGRAPVA